MKYVKASLRTHDAAIGPVLVGETYYVEDDKAERWINAGIATAASKPPDPKPPPEPEPDDDEEEGEKSEEEKDPEELAAEAHKLHDAGDSERAIAQKLNISRTRVHGLLTG